jgi:hypothetical protein
MPFYVHHLSLVKLIIEKMAKYLVLPGLDVDININGKIVTLNNEIMIRVETPEDFQMADPDPSETASTASGSFSGGPGGGGGGGGGGRERNVHSYREKEAPSAITLRAEINLADLLQDTVDIESYLKHTADITDQLLYADKVAQAESDSKSAKETEEGST